MFDNVNSDAAYYQNYYSIKIRAKYFRKDFVHKRYAAFSPSPCVFFSS